MDAAYAVAMPKKIHIPWRCLVVLLATPVVGSPSCETAGEAPSLLQLKNDAAVEDLVATLRSAKKSCFEGSNQCLEDLSRYRNMSWPKVLPAAGFSSQLGLECSWLPKPFGPWDTMVSLPCKDQEGEMVMFYRHVWKSAGTAIRENIKKIPGSRSRSRSPSADEICKHLDPNSGKHFLFTFVREPISRFLSAYAEIEHRVRTGGCCYVNLTIALQPFAAGSLARAEAFFQEFVNTGINRDGHVKPQIEYLGSNANCTDPMNFIGHAENLTADWGRMLDALPCKTSEAFDVTLGDHPNDPRDKEAAQAMLTGGEVATASFLQSDAATSELQRAAASMEQMLGASPQNLKALCWIYLPDFVAFGYDLPQPCQEDPTLKEIVQRSRH